MRDDDRILRDVEKTSEQTLPQKKPPAPFSRGEF